MTYRAGDYFCICDRCGFRFLRSQLKKTWDGLLVCSKDFEQRHPQDFVRGIKERISVPDARPEGEDRFLSPGDVTANDL